MKKAPLLKSFFAATVFLISNITLFGQMISFSESPNMGCAPLTVTFTNTTTDPAAYRYEWNFQDGTPMFVDTMPTTVTHTFTSPNNYGAYINVYNITGGYLGYSYGSSGNVQVNGVSFNSVDSSCVNDQVSFCPNGQTNSCSWNFGDGNTSSMNGCVNHAYASLGTYTITLTANTSSCGTQTSTRTIVVSGNAYPHPYFNVNMLPACPGQSVNFGTAPYTTYLWNFGDGFTSTLQNPSHIYGSVGTYTATLTVTNGCGHTGINTQPISIILNPPFPNQPWFSVQAHGSPICPNSNIGFDAPYGYANYQWNFGDGSPLITTSNSNNNHTYGSTPGTFPVSVKVTSVCGNDTTLYTSVQVSNTAPFPTGSWFQLNTSSPSCPNSDVNFQAPGGFTNYAWNFGDGTPVQNGADNSANHNYGSALTNYTVSVTITNGCGNDTTLTSVVHIMSNVSFPNQSWFQLNTGSSPACVNDEIGWNAPGGYSNYQWNFGDGNTAVSNQNYATHLYGGIGTYTASVTITNTCGNDTTISGTVTLNGTGSFPSYLQIQPSPMISCPNDAIQFELNQNGYATYAWDFGDGNTANSTAEKIEHAYSAIGTYTVTCLITNGCGLTTTITTTVQVTNSGPVNTNLTISGVQNPSCPGDNVFFVIEHGIASYTYVWNYGDGSPVDTTIGAGSSHIFATAGTYNVTTTIINGCGSTAVITTTEVISGSAVPVLSMNGHRMWGFPGGDHGNVVGCSGDAVTFYFEGSAAINSWNFGDGTTGTAVDNMVVYTGDGSFPVTIINHAFAANGTYLISLTLTNGCGNSVTDTMTIHVGGSLTVSGDMTTSPPPFSTCASVDFLAFGGSTYGWNFGDGNTLTTSSPTVSHTFSTQGVYVVTVLVTNGCGNTATFSRSINVDGVGGPAITITSTTAPTCMNGNNGSAVISVANGQPPYVYSWNDPSGQTTASASGLTPGLYYATVTDNIGCASTMAVSISNPAPIVLGVTTMTTACGAATGTATVTVTSGGTAPFTYLWSNGQTTATATGLGSGSYSVMVTDSHACSSTSNASISESGGATVSVNSTANVDCSGNSTGAIDINVTGGSAPYTYVWSNAATTQDISGIPAGSYTVTVTDNSGCHASLNSTITQSAPIVVATSVVTAPTCGNFDGKANAAPSGGTGPFTYLWDVNAASQTTATAVGLPAGTYTVTVTDVKGCSMTGVISLSNSNAPNISAVVTDVSCFGGNNGAIDITVTGGTSPYLYNWSVGPPQTNHQDINTLTPGNYLVFVNDAHGCLSFRTYTISQPSLLAATVTNTGATCLSNDGTATATVTGGTIPYTYSWTGGQTAQTAVGLALGSYTVTTTDSKGCTAMANTTIAPTTLVQDVCMVTVDTTSTHNIIYWEKAAVTNVDSFRIYREVTAGVYSNIASVAYDSLSEYHDYGANPNTTSYKYKIGVIDNCGHTAMLSDYHNTIHLQILSGGNLQWTLYDIENTGNPVSFYRVYRDDLGTNNFLPISSTIPGGNSTYTDINFASYPNANYLVDVNWSISCTPTRAALNTTRSNIKHQALATGVVSNDLSSLVSVYPNPANDHVTIELSGSIQKATIKLMNVIGQTVYEENISAPGGSKTLKQIDVTGYAKGVYTVSIDNNGTRIFKKFVVN